MWICLCQMYNFPRATVQTLVRVLKPQAPPHLLPPDTTVHTAVEGPETIATDQVNNIIQKHLNNRTKPLVCFTLILTVYVDIHTEAVQAALAKHKEEKMALPMPTKRRSAFVQSPIDTCTPPGELVF